MYQSGYAMTFLSAKVKLVSRGAHTAFLRMGQVPRWGGYTVNLIHYEDAASLTAAVCSITASSLPSPPPLDVCSLSQDRHGQFGQVLAGAR